MSSYILLSISGHDRPGIVEDLSEALLHLNANIEDSSMSALRGRFTMMVIVQLNDKEDLGTMKASLAELEQRTKLTVQSQTMTAEEVATAPPEPTHVVTVSGADRPGIVHAVAKTLAASQVSIVDLSTRCHSDGDSSIYMMALEVSVAGENPALSDTLVATGQSLNVDVEIHDLDANIL
ncbi:MAG: ACT domain-containing protein [Mariprofundaceae bacterium]